jgi:starvation-inducible DNA-binding protein
MTMTIGVPHEVVGDREGVAARLQEALVDLIALGLNAKQAHWHVHGPQFLPVHQHLDTIVDDTRSWADLVAERAVTLGVPVDGRAATVAREATVDTFPTGYVDDAKAVALMAEQLDAVVRKLRQGVAELGEADPVSQDVVIEVLRGLEKHLWMLQAQRA